MLSCNRVSSTTLTSNSQSPFDLQQYRSYGLLLPPFTLCTLSPVFSYHRALVANVELHEAAAEDVVLILVLRQHRLLHRLNRRRLGRDGRTP